VTSFRWSHDQRARAYGMPPRHPASTSCPRRLPAVRIYTKRGDDGSTGLLYGGRLSKADLRVEAYGTADEAVAALGMARAACSDDALVADILRVQRELFVAGAELATAPDAAERLEDGVSRITEAMVSELEPIIDRYMERVELPPQFVIPGGTELSAALDVARSAVRRAERRTVTLREAERLASDAVLHYLNRASDLVYAMARYADEEHPKLFEGRAGEASA